MFVVGQWQLNAMLTCFATPVSRMSSCLIVEFSPSPASSSKNIVKNVTIILYGKAVPSTLDEFTEVEETWQAEKTRIQKAWEITKISRPQQLIWDKVEKRKLCSPRNSCILEGTGVPIVKQDSPSLPPSLWARCSWGRSSSRLCCTSHVASK